MLGVWLYGATGGKCQYSDQKIKQSCSVINFCFGLFVVTRVVLSVKCIGRVVEASLNGQRGVFSAYVWMAIVHGPLFVFGIASLLFWAQLLSASRTCVDMELLKVFRLYASYSSLVSLMCCLLTFWHSLIVGEDLRRRRREDRLDRRPPPGIVETMATVPYDPDLFGQEDGRQYTGECPICLGDFGPEEVIKVTHCGHAFHKACLGRWLRKERTCALCRSDVVTQQAAAEVAEVAASAPDGSAQAQALALGRLPAARVFGRLCGGASRADAMGPLPPSMQLQAV